MRAVVSGATGGIGAEFCRRLAAQGYDLMVTSRRQDALDQLRHDLEASYGVKVETHEADLAVRGDLEALATHIAGLDDVEILVNNAGLVAPGPFALIPLATQLEMIDVHVTATVRLCRAALPAMIQRRRGIVINVSSLGGFMPDAGDVLYSATKRFIIHFSRSLAAATTGTGVRIQALCPGFTKTKIHDVLGTQAFIPPMFWMTPREVVDASFAALTASRVVCIPSRTNQMLVRLLRFPWLFRRVLGWASTVDRWRGWKAPGLQ